MSVIGAMESGLTGSHETLFAKSTLDGLAAIIFASSLGIGVAFSAIPILIYQGFITLTAGAVRFLIIDIAIIEMSAIGGLLLIGIGLNFLGVKKIRVGNMIPALFIPLLYYSALNCLNKFT